MRDDFFNMFSIHSTNMKQIIFYTTKYLKKNNLTLIMEIFAYTFVFGTVPEILSQFERLF